MVACLWSMVSVVVVAVDDDAVVAIDCVAMTTYGYYYADVIGHLLMMSS